jgi:PAS domain S-box-containing protein
VVDRFFAEVRSGQEPGINGHGTERLTVGAVSLPAESAVLDPVPFLIAAGERLDASLDFDQTIGAILDIIVPALADQAAIHLLLEDGRFRRVAARNPTAESEAISQELGDEYLDSGQVAGPIHRMLADGRSLIGSPLTDDDIIAIVGTKYRAGLLRKMGLTSAMVVPLAARGRRTGVLTMATTVRPRFDPSHRHLAEEIGRRAGLALDTARLYGTVCEAQRDSERARQRMAFLAEASAALSASLDIHTTLQTVAELATREIAESCNLALVGDDGLVRRVAVAHADQAMKGVFDAHSDIIPIGPGSTHPIASVLATGRPYVNNLATEATRRAYGEGPYRELMDRVSFTAGVVVPLEARGRRIGVMNLGTSVPGQTFDEDDVALCVQLASRAALAIDNARLYQAARTAHDRLAEQLGLSDAVVKNIAEAIIVSDRSGQVTYVNPMAELLLEQTSADLVGRDSHVVAHVSDLTGGPPPGHDCRMREAIRAGMTVRLDGVRLLRADGKSFPADVSAAPLMKDGQMVGAVTIFRDVSDRQRHREALERSEERLRRALDSAGMVMWERSFVTGRTLRSDLASTIYGRPNEELVDDPDEHSRLVHPDDVEYVQAIQNAAVRDGVGYESEYRVLWPDGTVRWVSSRANVFRTDDGEPLGMSGTTHDITTRKQAELELNRLLEERQAEAAELRQLHQRLRQRLEAVLGLHEVGKLLTSASDLNAAGRRILEIAVRAARLHEATLRRRTGSGKTRVWQRVGRTHGATAACETRALTRARRRTLATGQPGVVQVTCRCPDATLDPRTVWCVPLIAKGDVIGVLESVGGRQPADEPTLEILGSIALQAATALENARLYREVADSERALHHLVQQLMAAHEDERRRLAYEIHDGFAQMAAGVQQLVEAYAHDFPSDSHAGRQRMDIAIGLARQTVSEIRRVLAGLRPTVLDDFGLARGLRAYAEGLAAERLSVRFSEAIGTQRLPSTIEIALFRVAQEALTNVRKHAGVESADLRLARRHADIVLEVEDRGRGFDLAAVANGERPGQHLGLLSMHERIGHVNGTLEILSQHGKGTLVRVVVPIVGSRAQTIVHGGTDGQTTDAHDRR